MWLCPHFFFLLSSCFWFLSPQQAYALTLYLYSLLPTKMFWVFFTLLHIPSPVAVSLNAQQLGLETGYKMGVDLYCRENNWNINPHAQQSLSQVGAGELRSSVNHSLGAHCSSFIACAAGAAKAAHPLPCCISLWDYSLSHTEDMQVVEPFFSWKQQLRLKSQEEKSRWRARSWHFASFCRTNNGIGYSCQTLISLPEKCRKWNGKKFRSDSTEILFIRTGLMKLMNIFKCLSASWSIIESIWNSLPS